MGLPNDNCDHVCQSRDLRCTEENHGFTDDNVLDIFASLLKNPCETGLNDEFLVQRWKNGPVYRLEKGKKGWCVKWKSIPDKIKCQEPTIVNPKVPKWRLCPCVAGKVPGCFFLQNYDKSNNETQ